MSKKSTRVLLVIPNLGRGGAQNVFRQQLEYLSNDFEVMGCVFNRAGAFPDDHGGNIFSLDVPAGKNYFGKAWYFILRIIRLRNLKKQKHIDVSISHLEGADYVNVLSRVNDKVICWIHGTKKHDENISGLVGALRMKVLIPHLYKRADRLITVSKGIAGELSKHIKGINDIIQTIYNGFDIERIVTLSKEPLEADFSSLFEQSNIIITHCRLSRQKNLSALLLIFSKIKHQDGTKLVIVGDGELREELLSTGQNLGLKTWTCWNNMTIDLSSNIFFIGQQRNPFKFLRHAKIYLLTSGWEGFPLALCEAMVCGLPVIAADCFTGPREIIAPQIELPQPVATPYSSPFGILMPLADASNPEAIGQWVNEIEKLLLMIKVNPTQYSSGIVSIREFALSESISQTVNLVHEVLYEE